MFKFVSITLAVVFVSAASAQEAWKPASYCAAAAPALKSMVNKGGDYNIEDNTHQREYIGLFERATAQLPPQQQQTVSLALNDKRELTRDPFKDKILRYERVFHQLHQACQPCGGAAPCYMGPVTNPVKVN